MTFSKGLLLVLLSASAVDTGLAFARCVSRASLEKHMFKTNIPSCLFFPPSGLGNNCTPGTSHGQGYLSGAATAVATAATTNTNGRRHTLLRSPLSSYFRTIPTQRLLSPLAAAYKLLSAGEEGGTREQDLWSRPPGLLLCPRQLPLPHCIAE